MNSMNSTQGPLALAEQVWMAEQDGPAARNYLAGVGRLLRRQADLPIEVIGRLWADSEGLLAAMEAAPPPVDEWIARLHVLSGRIDNARTAADMEINNRLAAELLAELDSFELALAIAKRFVPDEPWVGAQRADVQRALDVFEEHIEVFFPSCETASGLLSAVRPGLEDDLFATLLKFLRIEEVIWEMEYARISPAPLSERDKEALSAKVAARRNRT